MQLTQAQTDLLVTRAQTDPVWWLRQVLGANPWRKQCEIAEAVRDSERTAVASCHGPGKSWIAARIALWFMFAFRRSIVATTAPTFRQVQKVLWQELRQAHRTSRIPLGGHLLQTELHLDDKWFGFGFSTDDSNRFQGLHAEHVLVIFDEAAGVPKENWTATEGILTSEHCRFLAIGNPTESSGPFYEMFREPGVAKIHVSAFDIPNVQERRVVVPGLTTYEWVEDKRLRWGEASPIYQSRVLGRFPSASANAVIPLAWVEAAIERWHAWKEAGAVLGRFTTAALDPADGGEDRSILALRYDSVLAEIRDVTQPTPHATMALAGIVKGIIDKYGGTATVDSIGIGAGVVSRLRELGIPAQAFNAAEGTAATDESGELGFTNRRAAAWWGMRERLHPETGGGIALPPDDELIGDLTAPRILPPTSTGKIRVESKDEIRKRIGRSTDRGDAVVMAFDTHESGIDAATADLRGPMTAELEMAGAIDSPDSDYFFIE